MEGSSRESPLDYRRFFEALAKAKGVSALLAVSLLAALAAGCVVGVIPDTVADRYARIHHGYVGDELCSNLDVKPTACRAGTDDAQAAASWSNVGLFALSFFCNPVVGTMSDVRGRRYMILANLVLACIPAIQLVVLLRFSAFNPFWYYASDCLRGIFSYVALTLAALSDSVPKEFRAATFGILFAVFYGGFAVGPCIPLVLTHGQTAATSVALTVAAIVIGVVFLPETLPDDIRQANLEKQRQNQRQRGNDTCVESVWHVVGRPLRDMSILNRDWTIRLLTVGSFLSSMVFAADATLVVYYIEDRFDVHDADIAGLFLALGIAGILLQAGALQPLVKWMGDYYMLIATFACGSLHNFLYGVARTKAVLYLAMVLSQFTKLNNPVLSAVASKDVSTSEQGRILGAMFATNAVAEAIGPLSMEFVYHQTKNTRGMGRGFMFVYAAFLYALGTVMVALIPSRDVSRQESCLETNDGAIDNSELEEPLLTESEGTETEEADNSEV